MHAGRTLSGCSAIVTAGATPNAPTTASNFPSTKPWKQVRVLLLLILSLTIVSSYLSLPGFEWVQRFADRSVTELEMLYGALMPSLAPPAALPFQPLFCIRTSDPLPDASPGFALHVFFFSPLPFIAAHFFFFCCRSEQTCRLEESRDGRLPLS